VAPDDSGRRAASEIEIADAPAETWARPDVLPIRDRVVQKTGIESLPQVAY
jgi:hypothetical protein